MNTIAAVKEQSKVTFYQLRGEDSEGFPEQSLPSDFIQVDDIIIASTCNRIFNSALHTIKDGMKKNAEITKKYLVTEFAPLIIRMCDAFKIDYYNEKKYLNLDGDLLIAQKDRLYWLDRYLNVYSIPDYACIGDNASFLKTGLFEAKEEEVKPIITESLKLLLRSIPYDGRLYTLDTESGKKEVSYDTHC